MSRAPQPPTSRSQAQHQSEDEQRACLPRRGGSARARSRAAAGATTEIELGTRVRVVEGPFEGKIGVVQEVGSKGGVRVKLGLLTVRFELANLRPQVDGRIRRALGTSHRKPTAARS